MVADRRVILHVSAIFSKEHFRGPDQLKIPEDATAFTKLNPNLASSRAD